MNKNKFKVKCVCISDTHGKHRDLVIPECDYLFHTGDLTARGTRGDLIDIANWFLDLKEDGTVKEDVVIIAGNHDACLEREYESKSCLDRLTYLENQSFVLVNGTTIFGSPNTPAFLNWYFMEPREKMYDRIWKRVPIDTEILLTHGPAYSIRDEVDNKYSAMCKDKHVGCQGLFTRAFELPKLKYVIHGHIHGGYGIEEHKGKKFVNCSSCDESYDISNNPIVIEI
jgi:Icc-related predicted phosphoesterase